MVKIDRSFPAPASLAIEKEKGTKNYREADVIDQLHQDFNGKCYLCEIDKLQSIQVEHLKQHHNGKNRDLMFDWENLFFCCPHCNSVKNEKQYESIIDCCRVEPESCLEQQFIENHVRVDALDDSPTTEMTAQLITACFEKTNTGIRIHECKIRVESLQEIMIVLYRNLEKYNKNPTNKTIRTLKGMLNRSYKFAGFTRTYVRKHIDDYPNLAQLVSVCF